jgi:hypothetical protein
MLVRNRTPSIELTLALQIKFKFDLVLELSTNNLRTSTYDELSEPWQKLP